MLENIANIRLVLNTIKENPEKHDQRYWFKISDEDEWDEIDAWNREPEPGCTDPQDVHIHRDVSNFHEPVEEWECGSTACVAGLVCILNGYLPISGETVFHPVRKELEYVSVMASDLLGLDVEEAKRLFMRTPSDSIVPILEMALEDESWNCLSTLD